jgi:hypothetical protein
LELSGYEDFNASGSEQQRACVRFERSYGFGNGSSYAYGDFYGFERLRERFYGEHDEFGYLYRDGGLYVYLELRRLRGRRSDDFGSA